MNLNNFISIINKIVNKLYESEIIDQRIDVVESTPIFGLGSIFDSMAFVSLISDVEDSVNTELGTDIYIVLSDIEDLFPNESNLTAGMLAYYLISVTKGG